MVQILVATLVSGKGFPETTGGLTPEGILERIDLRGQPIDLDITLSCGQAFRWRKREDGVWSGVVRDRLIELTTTDGELLWRTYPAGGSTWSPTTFASMKTSMPSTRILPTGTGASPN